MPRRAPDGKGVTEHRITFGNYERQFVTEIKNDVQKTVKTATIAAAVGSAGVAIASIVGFGLLGYGIYRGADAFQAQAAETLEQVKEKAKKTGKEILTVGSEPGSPFIILNPLGPLFKAYFKAKEEDLI